MNVLTGILVSLSVWGVLSALALWLLTRGYKRLALAATMIMALAVIAIAFLDGGTHKFF